MPANYAALAPVYDTIRMGSFAESLTPRLINYAQRHEWLGRRIIDLGCGTGASLQWLARHSYSTTGVDNAPAMLEIARAHMNSSGLNYTLHERDIRELSQDLGIFDMVLAFDVVNELNSLRELEAVFKGVHGLLGDGKLFVFDMHTIQGMTERGTSGESLIHDDQSLAVFTKSRYDYDRQLEERQYVIFRQQTESDLWERSAATRTLRAYPAQAVASLLQRSGFQNTQALHLNFEPFDPGASSASRIIFIAEKQ